tara:strand:+ start:839 stop:1369 length:531 start_codon:yes stop_codon:yes gene_type:complete
MKKLIFVLFFQFLFSQAMSVEIDLEKSFISYDGKHPAHNWTGISKEIKGSFMFDQDQPILSSVDLYVPVFSFDSRNSNRDSNMLDVIEDYFYPSVSFTSLSVTKEEDQYYINGVIFFHGIKKEVMLPVDFIVDNGIIVVDTNFDINLSDYNIKRPSLLTIKMKDKIKITFHLVGQI